MYSKNHRWQTLGRVDRFVLLLVVHTVRDEADGTEVIRIISARHTDSQKAELSSLLGGIIARG